MPTGLPSGLSLEHARSIAGASPPGHVPSLGAWAAMAVIAAAAAAGAWPARRDTRRLVTWLATAAAIILIIAVTDLLPGAWYGALATGLPPWAIVLAAVAGFLVTTFVTRPGGPAEAERRTGRSSGLLSGRRAGHRSGRRGERRTGRHSPGRHRPSTKAPGTAPSLGAPTAAPAEGADAARRRVARWLAITCAVPAAGIALTVLVPLPARPAALLLAAITGVLARATVVGLRLAAAKHRTGRPTRRQLAAVAVAAVTTGTLVSAARYAGLALDSPARGPAVPQATTAPFATPSATGLSDRAPSGTAPPRTRSSGGVSPGSSKSPRRFCRTTPPPDLQKKRPCRPR
ncbi:hypothetical protein [Spirillospora sp. NPDC047279]|uniref:hypothetical protein n=1 Tax=Spirillospora sp. NPDC047279 TaxID=3155478 RepID=UPI0033DC45C7